MLEEIWENSRVSDFGTMWLPNLVVPGISVIIYQGVHGHTGLTANNEIQLLTLLLETTLLSITSVQGTCYRQSITMQFSIYVVKKKTPCLDI